MQSVIETHKRVLNSWALVKEDPLHLFSIACGCRFEDQATFVARNAELAEISKHFDPNKLKGLTFEAYGRLVSFLAQSEKEWDRILRDARVPPHYCDACRADPSKGILYDKIKRDLHQPYLKAEEVYFRALEHRSDCESKCTASSGPFGHSKIEAFIKGMMEQREAVYDKFQPAKWFEKGE